MPKLENRFSKRSRRPHCSFNVLFRFLTESTSLGLKHLMALHLVIRNSSRNKRDRIDTFCCFQRCRVCRRSSSSRQSWTISPSILVSPLAGRSKREREKPEGTHRARVPKPPQPAEVSEEAFVLLKLQPSTPAKRKRQATHSNRYRLYT